MPAKTMKMKTTRNEQSNHDPVMNTYKTFLTDLLEAEHSKAQTLRIVEWIGGDAERLAALMEIFMGDEYRLTQRSAWAVQYVCKKYPYLLAPWQQEMIVYLRKPGIHDAVKRNILSVFEKTSVPAEWHGELADICFGFLASPNEAVAIRCLSMSVLADICEEIPELTPELRLLLETHYEHGTAALKSRTRSVLTRLAKR